MFKKGEEVAIWTHVNRYSKRKFGEGVVEKVIPNSHANYYMVLVRYHTYGQGGKETTTGWFKSTNLTVKGGDV